MSVRSAPSLVFFVVVCLILVGGLVCSKVPVVAVEVWSDDFNDGNLDGWTVTYGSFSTVDNSLRALVPSSCINHSSSVNIGTWSFDLYISGLASSGAHVCYSCESFVIYPITGYDLKVSPNAFELMVWYQSYDDCIGSYYPPTRMTGWQHVDITRDSTGHICVFINGTLQIETEDTTITISNYFHFFCGPDEGLDNVVVSDSIDITPSTNTTPSTPMTPQIPGFHPATIILGIIIAISLGHIIHRRK